MSSISRVGLISDTHGLLRPEALDALQGVDHIVHAGDIDTPDVLDELARVAPVTAVRGNNDRGPWAQRLAEREAVEIGGVFLYVLHDLGGLDVDPVAAGFQVIVAGHSHRPRMERREGVLFVNPGSAGPRRFNLPIALGFLDIVDGRIAARIQHLA